MSCDMLQVQKPYMDQDQRRMRSPSVISTMSYDSVASSTKVQPSSIYSPPDDASDLDDITMDSATFSTEAERARTPDMFQGDDDDEVPFSALALYDFESDDPDHMPFRKNEIIQIIVTEDSGWWAAQRDDVVGWVPGSFVAFIPPRLVRRLQALPPEVREHDYNAEVVHAMAGLDLEDVEFDRAITMAGGDRDSFVTDATDLVSPRGFPTDVTPSVALFNIPNNFPSQPLPPALSNVPSANPSGWLPPQPRSYPYGLPPQTPRTPMAPRVPVPAPQPQQPNLPYRTLPPTPAFLNRSATANNPPALKVTISPLSINKNKPTPPTPRASTPPPVSLPSPSPVFSISKNSVASSSSSSLTSFPRSRSVGSPAMTSVSPASMKSGRRLFESSSSAASFSPSPQRQRAPRLSNASSGPYVTSPNQIPDFEEDDVEDGIPGVKFARNASVSGGSIDKIKRLTGDDKAQAFANAKRAQAMLPWYLKPIHEGDEIKLEHDGSVRAGTLEALVERLTMPALRAEHEERFRNTFLTTFHAFTTAEEVFELLVERYQMDAPTDLGEEQFEEWKNKNAMPTRSRVLFTLKVWVESHGLAQDDPRIIPRLLDFLKLVISPPPHAQTAQTILNILQRRREPSPPLHSVPLPNTISPTPPRKSSKRGRSELLRLDYTELARQLTLYEGRLYMKIRPHECMTWANAPRGDGVKNLKTFVGTNDKLAAWVKMSVLGNDALGRRADTIDMWIKVAEKCRALNNFSSMSAIVAALTSQVIGRLQLTWAHVHRASHIDPLVKLVQPVDNFGALRSALTAVDGPCLPYIGIYLSDMVRVSEPIDSYITVPITDVELIDALGGVRELKLINFIKYQRMADTMQNILKHQRRIGNYGIQEVQNTMRFVEVQLDVAASKDEGGFWMRSQEVQHAELAHADIRKGLEAAGF